ncbi:MAG: Gfo/Idh/MocA family oxidoreductase [Hormoscilla sp. SP5CHS1]|nr:Gfo/Idh/MocA family oxidoreductase [Hormoscilla sp. SP5CHS1]
MVRVKVVVEVVLPPVNNKHGTETLRVGIVGTGYAAKMRAQTLQADRCSDLVAVAGHSLEKTQEFALNYGAEALSNWQDLVDRSDLDLAIVCTVNRDHGVITRAALNSGKHVVVEYPLCLDATEAEELIALAAAGGKLLHVEHIELLGGLHQAFKQSLLAIGNPFYLRYATIAPKQPALPGWKYNRKLFGFPLTAALSRLHRLTDALGTVTTVSCQVRYWPVKEDDYSACLCTAQLRFANGAIADLLYGKGETFWQAERKLEAHGDRGTLIFDRDRGFLVRGQERTPIEVASRQGLFARDTGMVLDHLITGTPLYLSPEASLYSLKIANAAQQSAATGQIVNCEL